VTKKTIRRQVRGGDEKKNKEPEPLELPASLFRSAVVAPEPFEIDELGIVAATSGPFHRDRESARDSPAARRLAIAHRSSRLKCRYSRSIATPPREGVALRL
jgi:hypothetical protein